MRASAVIALLLLGVLAGCARPAPPDVLLVEAVTHGQVDPPDRGVCGIGFDRVHVADDGALLVTRDAWPGAAAIVVVAQGTVAGAGCNGGVYATFLNASASYAHPGDENLELAREGDAVIIEGERILPGEERVHAYDLTTPMGQRAWGNTTFLHRGLQRVVLVDHGCVWSNTSCWNEQR